MKSTADTGFEMEQGESLLGDQQHDCTKSTDQFETTQPRRLLRTAWLPWILIAILTASYVPFMAAYIAKKPSDKQCARQLSVWCQYQNSCFANALSANAVSLAPLQDAVEYESYDFDNDFDHQTIYRGPPSSKLEHAWDKLWQSAYLFTPNGFVALLIQRQMGSLAFLVISYLWQTEQLRRSMASAFKPSKTSKQLGPATLPCLRSSINCIAW